MFLKIYIEGIVLLSIFFKLFALLLVSDFHYSCYSVYSRLTDWCYISHITSGSLWVVKCLGHIVDQIYEGDTIRGYHFFCKKFEMHYLVIHFLSNNSILLFLETLISTISFLLKSRIPCTFFFYRQHNQYIQPVSAHRISLKCFSSCHCIRAPFISTVVIGKVTIIFKTVCNSSIFFS